MKKIRSLIIIMILLMSTMMVAASQAEINTQAQIAQIKQEAATLIDQNQLLSGWQSESSVVGIGTVEDIAYTMEDLNDHQKTIFTHASISIVAPMTSNIVTKQTIDIKYIGGQIDDKKLEVLMNWPTFSNDSVIPPNSFKLTKGMNIMFFAKEDNTLAGYIPYTLPTSESSLFAHAEPQPTTSCAESWGYGFAWPDVLRMTWNQLPHYYYIDPDGTNDIDGSGTSREFAAIQAGFDTWENDRFSGIDWTYGGTTFDYDSWTDYACWTGDPGGDNRCVVGWVSDYTDQNGTALAKCFRHFVWDGSGWTLTESDIMFADYSYNWVIGPTLGWNDFDVQSTATHEIGHALGLNDLYNAQNNPATMYYQQDRWGNTDHQTLEWGDLNGAHYIYPIHNDANTGGDGSNTLAGANTISTNTYYYGRLCKLPTGSHAEDTQDFYKFYVPSTDGVTIALYLPPNADFDLELYNPSGSLAYYSRTDQVSGHEFLYIDPIGVTGYWTIRVYTTEYYAQYSNGEYKVYVGQT